LHWAIKRYGKASLLDQTGQGPFGRGGRLIILLPPSNSIERTKGHFRQPRENTIAGDLWPQKKTQLAINLGCSASWFYKAGRMLRADIDAAGITTCAVIDSHSFRAMRVTRAILSAASPAGS
jgi:hypothetical protein